VISFSLSLIMEDTDFLRCIVTHHSPGGDAAAALSDTAFYNNIQSPEGDNATALAQFALSCDYCLKG